MFVYDIPKTDLDWRGKSVRRHYRKPFKLGTNLLVHVFLQMCVLTSKCAIGIETSTVKDLQTLATSFPGCYSTVDQYQKHLEISQSSHKLHFLKRSEIFKLSSPIFNDSLTFYFQDFTKSRSKPIRAGFYSFSADVKMDALRMKTVHLKRNVLKTLALRITQGFTLSSDITKDQSWAVDNLRTFSACDMMWKRLADGALVGITGPLCLGSLGPDQVRIGASMTLSRDKLLLTEGWYMFNDGMPLSEVTISYVLQRFNAADTVLYDHRSSCGSAPERTRDTDRGSLTSRQSPENETVSQPVDTNHDTETNTRKYPKKNLLKNPKGRRQKILGNFRQVVTTLTSGINVYFWIDLSMCVTHDNVVLEKSVFGGRIKNFVYVRNGGSQTGTGSYINFQSQNKVRESSGHEIIVRYVSLQKGGRVKVRVVKILSEPSWKKQEYSFDCRLYNHHNRYASAGVRLTLNPPGVVKSIKKVPALSSKSQGRGLQETVDFAQESR